MKKNVLILSSSPRRGGNSDLLCDEFLRGAQEAGHQAEKLFLSDHTIHYCTGCGVCNTRHVCTQKDDMAGILQKMVDADVIVLATPVYFYTLAAQMKTLIDRTCPRYEEITGKDFYFILTAADDDKGMMERTVECFRGFTEGCLEDAHEKGVIYGLGAWHAGEIRDTPAMEQAYQMGKSV